MKLLVIGGTQFAGRAIVNAAVERGHDVTLFNRGTKKDLFTSLRQIHGDRHKPADLEPLRGETFEAVIDVCGYTPAEVNATAAVLKDIGRYAFVSTVSVYQQPFDRGLSEDAPLSPWPAEIDPETTEIMKAYGPLKVRCEAALDDAFGDRALHIRPGFIAGAHDPTDRFTYWPVRVAEGGCVLLPPADAPLQVVDARDLAAFAVLAVERQLHGAFNVTGNTHTFAQVFDTCRQAAANDATPVHADEASLKPHGVKPYADLPLWMPGDQASFARISSDKAKSAGLTLRPLADTAANTLQWFHTERTDKPATGLSRDREQEVLDIIQK